MVPSGTRRLNFSSRSLISASWCRTRLWNPEMWIMTWQYRQPNEMLEYNTCKRKYAEAYSRNLFSNYGTSHVSKKISLLRLKLYCQNESRKIVILFNYHSWFLFDVIKLNITSTNYIIIKEFFGKTNTFNILHVRYRKFHSINLKNRNWIITPVI